MSQPGEATTATPLLDLVADLARTGERTLDGHLISVGDAQVLDGTRTTVRCHFVTRDRLGQPRIGPLVDRLVAQIVDYCIPRTRIAEAHRFLTETGSTELFSRLHREAKELFADVADSGEGGELLLYLLLEVSLGIPQLLCKMSLKTSSKMHYHGADGVHGKMLEDGSLALYWGESKVYADVSSAMDDCFDSLAPLVLDDGTQRAERDLYLLRDNLDAGDWELTNALRRFVTPDDPLSAQVEVRGACVIAFSLDQYGDPFTDDGKSVAAATSQAIARWHKSVSRRVDKHALRGVEIEAFCVPMPDVAEFRQRLRSRLASA